MFISVARYYKTYRYKCKLAYMLYTHICTTRLIAHHANDPTIVSHIHFDCPLRSDTKGHVETAMEFIAAKHENEFSLFNIASVRATGSKVKVSNRTNAKQQLVIGINRGRLNGIWCRYI